MHYTYTMMSCNRSFFPVSIFFFLYMLQSLNYIEKQKIHTRLQRYFAIESIFNHAYTHTYMHMHTPIMCLMCVRLGLRYFFETKWIVWQFAVKKSMTYATPKVRLYSTMVHFLSLSLYLFVCVVYIKYFKSMC